MTDRRRPMELAKRLRLRTQFRLRRAKAARRKNRPPEGLVPLRAMCADARATRRAARLDCSLTSLAAVARWFARRAGRRKPPADTPAPPGSGNAEYERFRFLRSAGIFGGRAS